MTWWVPVGLAVASLLFAGVAATFGGWRTRRQARRAAAAPRTYLVHAINDDRCTGCESCVSACPTNVLALVRHKSRAVRFQDCVQCEACARACPTTALVMHPLGAEPPPITMPDIDASFQTRVPGQYLIGEGAGKPLVKNAANLGRFVVEHMRAGGLAPGGGDGVDVAIVGSGPAGLSAALACVRHGLSYVVLEKERSVASTVARYPKRKPVMAEPHDVDNVSFLPVFETSKETLVATWARVLELAKLQVRCGEAVESIERGADGVFAIRTERELIRARRVVLAVGTRGRPRTLGVPGEDLPKVHPALEDPDAHGGRHALVVGGGDSAIEAALALAGAGARTTLAYRGRAFSRAKKPNRDALDAAQREGRVRVLLQCTPTEFTPSEVALQTADGSVRRVPNDVAFVLIGGEMPVTWLARVGVTFVERPHAHELGATDALVRTLVPSAMACPTDPAAAVARVRRERPATPAPRSRRLARGSIGSPSTYDSDTITAVRRPSRVAHRVPTSDPTVVMLVPPAFL